MVSNGEQKGALVERRCGVYRADDVFCNTFMCPNTGPAASENGMRLGAHKLTKLTSPIALATAAPTTVLYIYVKFTNGFVVRRFDGGGGMRDGKGERRTLA